MLRVKIPRNKNFGKSDDTREIPETFEKYWRSCNKYLGRTLGYSGEMFQTSQEIFDEKKKKEGKD